jgi:hypothetical protein
MVAERVVMVMPAYDDDDRSAGDGLWLFTRMPDLTVNLPTMQALSKGSSPFLV